MSGIYRGPNGSATADALNIDGDKGDISVSNSGLEWNINTGVVDTTKLGGDITTAGKALLDDDDAPAQRTTLGVVIGTDVLAFDSNLQDFVDTFTLPTTDSSNGFVLTTDGLGNLSLTSPGGIPDGGKGDIIVSSAGTVWTVDNDAITTSKILDDNVTYAKIQNVSATDKLLGRSSPGAGNIEEITCTSAGRALLDDVDASAQRTTLGLGAFATTGDGDKGDITVSGSASVFTIDNLAVTNAKLAFDGGALGYRNVLINGGMAIDQRNSGAAKTITAGAALAYTVDRWYAYCTGANVTGQQVAGSSQSQYRYRFTGAASVTKIGFAQRIEAANSYHLNNGTATLSVDLANSLLTTVTWTAWYANTADTFGSLASPTRTQIATGTFSVTSTVTRYSTNITIPSAATTGIEIEFSVAAQTSGTWTIGDVQLEAGSVKTPFETRSIGQELALCQRYYQTGTLQILTYQTGASPTLGQEKLSPEMRVAPTIVDSFTYISNSSTGSTGGISKNTFYSVAVAPVTGATQWSNLYKASAEL